MNVLKRFMSKFEALVEATMTPPLFVIYMASLISLV